MTEHLITVDESADTIIAAMYQQAQAIQQAWQNTNPEYATAAFSTLSRVLHSVLIGGWGQTKVYRDGDLDLLTIAGITVGVVFFAKHRDVKEAVAPDIDMSYGAKRTGRYCMASIPAPEPDVYDSSTKRSTTYCGSPFTWKGDIGNGLGVRTCEGHDTLTVTMPVPGEWSTHS